MTYKHRDIIKHLMQQGKGILAADESTASCTERFLALGIPSTELTRRDYRELLLTTPGVERQLSGVILYDETIRQALATGTPFPDYLQNKNIFVGIKVDQGLMDDPQFNGGEVTKGLDGLRDRLVEYRNMGATFTKWRSVVHVGASLGSESLRENASRMAAYAELVLTEGMIPIVEPEVLKKGAHSADDAAAAITEALSVVVDALHARDIDLRHIIIKTSMAVPGTDSSQILEPAAVAELTVRALTAAIPEEVGGVVFLSGGQTPEEATANYNAIARKEPLPWPVTFSFSRALQEPALHTWLGKAENVDEAQAAFAHRLSLVVAADAAGYTANLEETPT